MTILFTSSTKAMSVHSDQEFVNINDMKLILPALPAGEPQALITLNMPNDYSVGKDYPEITYVTNVDDVIVARGEFTYCTKEPASACRMPTTLVVAVNLIQKEQTVMDTTATSDDGGPSDVEYISDCREFYANHQTSIDQAIHAAIKMLGDKDYEKSLSAIENLAKSDAPQDETKAADQAVKLLASDALGPAVNLLLLKGWRRSVLVQLLIGPFASGGLAKWDLIQH